MSLRKLNTSDFFDEEKMQDTQMIHISINTAAFLKSSFKNFTTRIHKNSLISKASVVQSWYAPTLIVSACLTDFFITLASKKTSIFTSGIHLRKLIYCHIRNYFILFARQFRCE